MAAIGSLQVILECDDGNFTTRIISAGQALTNLQGQAGITVNAVQNISGAMAGSSGSIIGWTVALGEARHAVENLNTVFGSWIEKIVEVNSQVENTTALLAGFSDAATRVERLQQGLQSVNQIMQMSTQAPFSFSALEDTFVKLKTAGVDPLNGSMKSLTDAIAAFGGDDQRLTRAGYAIQEMAGRGVISLQNLRRQLGQDIPGAVAIMAQSMDMTVQQLDEAVTKGTLVSRNAITQMLAEFDRVYGGAALQRMATFSGQIAQMETAFKRLALAAGGTQEGADPNQSFYRSVVDGAGKLNEALASPEMIGAAIRVNNALKSIADGAQGLIPIVPALANNIELLGRAIEVLGAVMTAKAIGALMSALGAAWVSLAGGAGTLVGMLTGLPGVLGSVLSGIGALGASALSAGTGLLSAITGIEGATIAATGLAGTLAAVTTGFAIIAIPVGILAGLALIISRLHETKGAADEAGAALKLLDQGDYSQSNQDNAAKELQALRDKSALLQQQLDIVQRIQRGDGSTYELRNVGGALGRAGINGANLQLSGPGAQGSQARNQLTEMESSIKSEIDRINGDIQVYASKLTESHAQLIDSMATSQLTAVNRGIAEQDQLSEHAYEQATQRIQKMREDALKNDPGDQSLISALNVTQTATRMDLYDQELRARQQALAQETALVQAATAAQDNVQAELHASVVRRLQEEIDAKKKQIDEALKDEGRLQTNEGDKDYQKQLKEASTEAQNLTQHVAQLNAQLDQGGTYVAKITAQLSAGGKLQLVGLGSDEGQQLLALAKQADMATEAVKNFKQSMAAEHQIDLGLDKATAELDAITLKLTDPQLPEAQRNFTLYQNQMNEALAKFAGSLNLEDIAQYTRYLQEADKVMDAIDRKRLSTTLGEGDRLATQAHNAYVNSLPAGQRAEMQHRDALNRLNSEDQALSRQALSPNLRPEDAEAIRRSQQQNRHAIDDENRAYANRENRAGAAAGRPSADAIQQLSGRLAELRAQVSGGDSEYAKWAAEIAASPAKYAAAKDSILDYAKAIDETNRQLKLARESEQALKNLQSEQSKAEQGAAQANEYLGRGKLLDIEKQILDFRTKQATQVAVVAAGPNAERDLPKANTAAQAGEEAEALRLIRERTDANKTAEDTIRKSFDDTLAGRRAAGEEEIAMEADKMQRLISLYVKDADERKQLEDNLASYINAKREELNQKTEDGLQKLARDWKDVGSAITQYGATALNTFVDDLTQQLTTGKAKWTDFANWAIQELVRIQLKAALAPVASSLSSATSGLSDFVKGLLPGGGSSSGSTNWNAGVTPNPQNIGTAYHSGGMVGSEATFSRLMPSSIFAAAPRFHSGAYLQSDEVPAVLQKGEGVFTSGQMGAIGNLNHNYAFVEQSLQALVQAANQFASSPASLQNVAPSPLYGAAANAATPLGAAPPVTLNVQNQTSQAITATAGTPRMDGEQMVVDIVVRNVQAPGPLRDAIRGIK
jgi:tape measure domain-containing protein